MTQGMLGIMVTKYEYLTHIAGVVGAAQEAGYPVSLFLNDKGVRFTLDPRFLELLSIPGVQISCCSHSCKLLGFHDRVEGITYGSQLDNAKMLRDCERVLVF